MKIWIGALCLALMVSQTVASEMVTVPINFDQGVPVVELLFSGNSYPFVLDLGSATAFHLSKKVVAQIPGLTYTGKKFRSMDITGKVQEAEELTIADLTVNGMAFGKVNGVTLVPWGMNLGQYQGPDPEVSVLGLGFFDGKKVIFDFAAKTMTFADEDNISFAKRVEGWTPVPYDRSAEGLALTFKSNKASYRMILDTPSTISLVKSKLAQERDSVEKCDMDLGPDHTCRTISVSFQGGRPLKPVLMDLPSAFSADGLVGRDFFEQFAVFLDAKNRSVRVKLNR
jgi:hypothetical protein